MKPTLLYLLVIFLWTPPAKADLSGWVGRYPGKDYGGTSFWKEVDLSNRLSSALSATDFDLVEACEVEAPVEKVEGYYVLFRCFPHDCGGRRVLIAVEGREGPLIVVLDQLTENGSETRILSFGIETEDIPEEILRKLFLTWGMASRLRRRDGLRWHSAKNGMDGQTVRFSRVHRWPLKGATHVGYGFSLTQRNGWMVRYRVESG